MRKVVTVLTDVGGAVIIVLALLTGADVTGRYVFNSPIKGVLELSEVILAAIVAVGIVVVTAERQHISVDILYERLSSAGRRTLLIVAAFIGVVVFAVLLWQGILALEDSIRVSERTDLLGVPKSPFRALLVAGFLASLLILIYQAVGLVRSKQDVE